MFSFLKQAPLFCSFIGVITSGIIYHMYYCTLAVGESLQINLLELSVYCFLRLWTQWFILLFHHWDQEIRRSGVLHSQGCTFSMKISLTDMQPSLTEKTSNVFFGSAPSAQHIITKPRSYRNILLIYGREVSFFSRLPQCSLISSTTGDTRSLQAVEKWEIEWCSETH